ncbi:hypothetical protein SO694_00032384 [Aureococcus anophagefferens]|uniref:TNFR-Cys domain-containing protein n=1 Tax=Aureococcus anophagefferens TaxID=44056 RepID=A0ABR1FKH0_AURAN
MAELYDIAAVGAASTRPPPPARRGAYRDRFARTARPATATGRRARHFRDARRASPPSPGSAHHRAPTFANLGDRADDSGSPRRRGGRTRDGDAREPASPYGRDAWGPGAPPYWPSAASSKTCAWVGKSPAKRCDKESKSKVLASDACPVACDACPTWAEVTEDLQETCARHITALEANLAHGEGEIAALKAANAELETANAALEGKVAELEAKLEAPTPAPTVDPTAAPTTAPAALPRSSSRSSPQRRPRRPHGRAPTASTCAANEWLVCEKCPRGATCDGANAVCEARAVGTSTASSSCLECPNG